MEMGVLKALLTNFGPQLCDLKEMVTPDVCKGVETGNPTHRDNDEFTLAVFVATINNIPILYCTLIMVVEWF
jgi:hypothetical protein